MNGLSMSKLCQGEALDGAIPNVKKISVVNKGCQQPLEGSPLG